MTPLGQDAVDALASLEDCESLTVLTGAGLSTECGVPDFRTPGSPWLVNKPIDFATFMADPAMRIEAWRRKFVMDDLYRGAQPGRGHRALTSLAEAGRLEAVVTQNIDGLHQAGGLVPERLIELHGNGTYARCLSCGARHELRAVRAAFEQSGAAPTCHCGGIVKSATVSFGETIAPERIEAAVAATRACDAFLAVGSSLVVRPAASFPLLAKRNGARLIIVNREPTPIDGLADHVVRADVGTFLATLADRHANNTGAIFAPFHSH